MGRRGRRPHPDILTPREWEVLDLLRERLTNEQIAERLGITLDGAKYHVSEILSKLGVGTREEAVVWALERRRWWELISLPVAARIAGAATLIAAAAGLAVLAWGVVVSEGGEARIIDGGHVGDYAVNEPVHFEKGFWLVKLDSTQIVALSDSDSHPSARGKDCPIDWRPDVTLSGQTGWFRGRCSGSNFGLDGHVASGPSPRGMDRYAVDVIAISNDEVRVDNNVLLCGPGSLTPGDSCTPAWPNQLPPPPTPPLVSRDIAVLTAFRHARSDVQEVEFIDVALTTHAAAKIAAEDTSMTYPEPGDNDPEWFALVRGIFTKTGGCLECRPVAATCMEIIVRFPDSATFEWASSANRPPHEPCAVSNPISENIALVTAASAADTQFRDRLPDSIRIGPTTFAAALASLQTRYGLLSGTPPTTDLRDVWQVQFTGRLYEPFDRSNPPPSPTTVPPCRQIDIVIDAETREPLLNVFRPSDECPASP